MAATRYSMATDFEAAGVPRLHVGDRGGTRNGTRSSMDIYAIMARAVADPDLVAILAVAHEPQRIIVSIDAREEIAAIQDWAQDGRMGST